MQLVGRRGGRCRGPPGEFAAAPPAFLLHGSVRVPFNALVLAGSRHFIPTPVRAVRQIRHRVSCYLPLAVRGVCKALQSHGSPKACVFQLSLSAKGLRFPGASEAKIAAMRKGI
ncbi:hypothetical protein FKM82_010139 [Ascaphus truei]